MKNDYDYIKDFGFAMGYLTGNTIVDMSCIARLKKAISNYKLGIIDNSDLMQEYNLCSFWDCEV